MPATTNPPVIVVADSRVPPVTFNVPTIVVSDIGPL